MPLASQPVNYWRCWKMNKKITIARACSINETGARKFWQDKINNPTFHND